MHYQQQLRNHFYQTKQDLPCDLKAASNLEETRVGNTG